MAVVMMSYLGQDLVQKPYQHQPDLHVPTLKRQASKSSIRSFNGGFKAPITRYYVDVRPLYPTPPSKTVDLPLLDTLPESLQNTITAFRRPEDRLMSLASQLLKLLFIHRTAKIPWDQVIVSRTPKPHGRPYWAPPAKMGEIDFGLEFNVSHQAGMVGIIGCKTPPLAVANAADYALAQAPIIVTPRASRAGTPTKEDSNPFEKTPVRLGLDIACTNEPNRTPKKMDTDLDFAKWADIFVEMFSDRELEDMKDAPILPIPSTPGPAIRQLSISQVKQKSKLRRFYTYWSLKEAYIKMVGEGLLASWLRELEFFDVHPPVPQYPGKWTPQHEILKESDLKIHFQGELLDDLKMELIAFGDDFVLSTAMRGVEEESDGNGTKWEVIDFEKDVRPCAEGTCSCLA
jgi:4'-phosphopantetheinyl transferase